MSKPKLGKVLITAGSTQTPIDKVRCISNIFKGKTGGNIARDFALLGEDVTLLTSSDEYYNIGIKVIKYKTYDDLFLLMKKEITEGNYQTIIHSAAVSDYSVSKIFKVIDDNTTILDKDCKISSSHDKLYLELVPTIKIIDLIRDQWNFKGKLVKFKLQVDMSDEELIDIAEKSRDFSKADLIVANCLEWCKERAFIIDRMSTTPVTRDQLSNELYKKL